MKKCTLAFLTVVLISPAVMGSADLVKHRAMNQRDQLNAAQGVAPATPGQPGGGGAGQPAGPQGISTVQQQNIDKLQADLAAIRAEAVVTDPQKQELQKDFGTLSRSTVKPTNVALAKLATDLSAALSAKGVAVRDLAAVAKNINIVLNCVNLSPAQAQTFATAAQTSLKNGGVPDTQAQAVGADLKGIITDLQKSKPKLYQ